MSFHLPTMSNTCHVKIMPVVTNCSDQQLSTRHLFYLKSITTSFNIDQMNTSFWYLHYSHGKPMVTKTRYRRPRPQVQQKCVTLSMNNKHPIPAIIKTCQHKKICPTSIPLSWHAEINPNNQHQ